MCRVFVSLALRTLCDVFRNMAFHPREVAVPLDDLHCCRDSWVSVQRSVMVLFDTLVDFMVRDDSFPVFPHVLAQKF